MSAAVGEPAIVSNTQTIPADISGQMLDLDEDDDLEVYSKDVTLTEGRAMNPSMQTSPGSMVNQYKFEEEEEEGLDTKDLFITVDNPESHVTAVETFITYRVLTKTTRSEFDSSEYEVRRRYQDFLWLKSKLEETHPTLIVHPLPEKFVMKGMVERFNNDFIDTRRKALHKFLNRVSDHPILSCSDDFKVFLTAQAWELTSHKKQGPGFLSRMGDTVRALSNSVRGVKNRPEEFAAMQEYVEAFSQKISSLDKVTQRIVKEQKEYLEELKEYAPTYTLWSGSEEEQLAEPLKGVAGCLERCCQETDQQLHHLSEVLVPTLHEYVLCSEGLKAVLRRRDHIQAEFEAKSEALATKKVDREAESGDQGTVWGSLLGRNPEQVRQQRQERLGGEIDQLKEEIDRLEDRGEWANNALKGDWSRWKRSMRADLKSAFLCTAEKNVDYYEKCLAVWETFLLSQKTDGLQEGAEDETS
ncbi:sorting nexin-7 isoform X1 [Hypomesus transpacificus]|uniref:sorting nexin-7 isoform X1 n=1 Tax=Hypomesus transpacificus TaxID=137520 RepID=UPI001F07CD28|nr:sorting nexin-7 isoform X1 [Hypomesus transpacificus]